MIPKKQLEHSYRTANYYLGGLVIIMQSSYIDLDAASEACITWNRECILSDLGIY